MATLFLLLFSLPPLWAQNLSTEVEFQQKKDFMNSRFDDFFNRQMQIQKHNEQREKAAGEIAPVRSAAEKSKEKIRQEYVRTRPKPQDREPARLADERERATATKKMLEYEKNYAQRQQDLRQMFSKSRKVPPEYDSGLKNPSSE